MYHPLIDPERDGATAEQNLDWMETLRGLRQEIEDKFAQLDIQNMQAESDPLAEESHLTQLQKALGTTDWPEGWSIFKLQKHLTEIAKSVYDEQLILLVELMQDYSHTANVMIESNIPWVFVKIKGFISLYPHVESHFDEMVSEGMLALTDAVHILATKPTPGEDDPDKNNPQGYIGLVAVRRIGRMLDGAMEPIPASYRPPHKLAVVDPRDNIEMFDILEAACQTSVDRQIVQLRAAGRSNADIAATLDIARRSVDVYLQAIFERYEKLAAKD